MGLLDDALLIKAKKLAKCKKFRLVWNQTW